MTGRKTAQKPTNVHKSFCFTGRQSRSGDKFLKQSETFADYKKAIKIVKFV